MKNMIVKLSSFVLLVICVGAISNYTLFSDDGAVNQKKGAQQKGSMRKQQGKEKPANSKMPAQDKSSTAKQQQEEEPIQDMETYVNEFDHEAKRAAVKKLLERGIEFCKKNDLRTVCHAFNHTKDFIEGSLYIFLIDTKGVIYAHRNQLELLWENLWNKRDMFGSLIIQSMIKLAKVGELEVMTYEWDSAIKVSLIQRIKIQGKEFVIGCGYFPHSKEYAVVSLVKGAVTLFNQYLKEGHEVTKAFSDMSYPLSSQFILGDLYLYALSFDGVIYAQGERPGLVGSPALNYADAKGKKYNAEIVEALKNKKEGEGVWIDYVSKRATKHAYAEKVKDAKGNYYFIAAGYYPEINRDTTVDLVRRGYQYMKSAGLSSATKAFTDEQVQDYRYGDLGLSIYDMSGKCLADGRRPDDVGQSQWEKKDEDGRFFIQEIIQQAKAGGGWISFRLNNSFQSMYVEKVDLGIGEYVIVSGMFPVSKPETMRLLVKSAIGYLNRHAMEDLLELATDRSDQFIRGDLFLYVLDLDGYCYAWGDHYEFIWNKLLSLTDDNGKPFVKLMIEAAQHGPEHLVLKMNKCQRVNYFEPIEKDGKKYLIGSGFYK